MENFDEDKIIDDILEKIGGSQNYHYLFSELLQNGISGIVARKIFEKIAHEDLAHVAKGDYISATYKTRLIVENGGYLVYCENKRIELEKEKERKAKEENYYRWQGELGKWYYKFRWLPFVFSFLAFIMSIVALFAQFFLQK